MSSYSANSLSETAPQSKHNSSSGTDPFFIVPPQQPTQEGQHGIRYDFNDGARIFLPQGQWHARIEDSESGNIIFECDSEGGWILSTKKYYVPFRIQVWKRGETEPVLDHTLDLEGKEVLIKFPVGTIGDIVGWMPYAEKFFTKHKCLTEIAMGKEMAGLFREQYPDIHITDLPGETKFKNPYASYRIGLFFNGNKDHQPIDFRMVGLHRTAGYILGVDPAEEAPRVKLGYQRKIKEPYVCIAVKSSCLAKMWCNGHGWDNVISHLKDLGYRVLCIDRDRITGSGYVWNAIPHGAEDFTGSIALTERVALLEHADFFIGLSSGLSWLAWCAKKPVVLISGFTLPICEFRTPYRVFNSHACNGCWDDINANFDHKDFFWCPRHKGTERQFECTRLITGKQVIGHIERLRKDFLLAAPKSRGNNE